MKRANTFEVVPQTENDKECLLRLLRCIRFLCGTN